MTYQMTGNLYVFSIAWSGWDLDVQCLRKAVKTLSLAHTLVQADNKENHGALVSGHQ